MQSANVSGRWKSGRDCEGQWLGHDEDRRFTRKTVVDLFLEVFSCYVSSASSGCNCGCRKVPCWGGCWGCRLKSVRVCAWNLNARNRYKSDRDCERRRADVQRPFAMPGIEGCTTCLLEACWAASSFVFVFLKMKRKLNGNSQFQWPTWIPGSWQHWVKRGQKWPVNMNYGFGWLSFYGERHLSVVMWKKQ